MDTKRKKIILIVCSAVIVLSFLVFIILVQLGNKERVAYLQIVGYLERAEEQSETSVYVLYANFMDDGEVLKNTGIYGFYLNNNTLPDYIVGVRSVNIGMDTYELRATEHIEVGERIDNIAYSFKLKPIIRALFVWSIIFSLVIIVCVFISEKIFLPTTLLLSLSCLIFQFWVAFPGSYIYYDGFYIISQALTGEYNNWHPVIIAKTYSVMFSLFGDHTYHVFLINLICWYGGITLLIFSVYLKCKSRFVILLFLLTFVQNIFFINFHHLKDVTLTMYMWLICNIILFQIIHQSKRKWINIALRVITAIVILLALLWRHNAIVTIYPLFLYFTYIVLNKFNIKSRVKYLLIYCCAMGLVAVLLISILKFFPLMFMAEDNRVDASRHLELQRIAAVAILSGDESLIPEEWYAEGKDFSDVQALFDKNKYFADVFIWESHTPFIVENTANSRTILFEYIKKYPANFLLYSMDYLWTFWQANQDWLENSYRLVEKRVYNDYTDILEDYEIPTSLELSKQKIDIINAIYSMTISLKVRVGIYASIILFFLSGYLWLSKKKSRNALMLFVFATAFSAFATAIIVGVFSPLIDSRYLMPVLPIAIVSLVSFCIS